MNRRLVQRWERPVFFSPRMIDHVRHMALAGYQTDAEIAATLAANFDERITTQDVQRWKRQHRRFNAVVANALADFNAECTSKLVETVRSGEPGLAAKVAMWQLERTTERYKPKSSVQHSGRADTLDDTLARRKQLTDDQLRERGVIIDMELDGEGQYVIES